MRKSLKTYTVVCGIICILMGTSIALGENQNKKGRIDQSIIMNFNNQLATSFTIIALPDTQNYASSYPHLFINQTEWIVAHKNELNIVWVTNEGDITNSGSDLEFQRANAAYDLLEDPVTTGLTAGIPYTIIQGNHDHTTTLFNVYFNYTRFAGRSYYGGHYPITKNNNNYALFSAGGIDFIAIGLDVGPDANELTWAENLLQTYSNRRAIIVSHSILKNDAGDWTTSGLDIYNTVKDHPNVFLMLCGHMHYEGRRTDIYNGNIIHTLLADYQDYPNGCNGWLRIMEIWPETTEIKVKTYSPYLNKYQTDFDSEFTLSYNLEDNQPPPTITGPVRGTVGVATEYTFTAMDPEGDQVYYFIDWGDGVNSGWIGPYPSGEYMTTTYTWFTMGTYTIKAKVKDISNHESNWATLIITMPYSYTKQTPPFIEIFFQRFPTAFNYLHQLMNY